jgi:hypothetical protein
MGHAAEFPSELASFDHRPQRDHCEPFVPRLYSLRPDREPAKHLDSHGQTRISMAGRSKFAGHCSGNAVGDWSLWNRRVPQADGYWNSVSLLLTHCTTTGNDNCSGGFSLGRRGLRQEWSSAQTSEHRWTPAVFSGDYERLWRQTTYQESDRTI